MPSNDKMLRMFEDQKMAMSESFRIEKAIVATTAATVNDKVEVTLPNSEVPTQRMPVQWRLSVKLVGAVLTARFPQRGDKGIVLYDDEDEAWLIW